MISGKHDAQARALLRRHGLRCTGPRLAVMSVLMAESAASHLTAQAIIDRLQDSGSAVDLTTVYRTLAALVDVGVLHALTAGDPAISYGLAEQPHHHAVCHRCGAVTAIPAERLSTALSLASEGSEFALSPTGGMTLHGLCPDCQRNA
ncbi:MAG: Fur family transcriptional regulator, ferric uptake regulator [Mycobacterium sp.]|jgi:Fur family ferric uptake transcriptional regulator|nr:Fur family transcriptional regulator, ferric uptake regulator [Mycobacterium sp.]